MTGNNKQYYKVSFDSDKVGLPPIKLLKFSNDIILNYQTPYSMFEVGSKVLCRFEAVLNDDDYDDTSIGCISDNADRRFKKRIKGTHVKWLGVVVKKLKNNMLKVMFSINSYESDKRRYTASVDKRRPFLSSNKERIVSYTDCTLLRKAPMCNA